MARIATLVLVVAIATGCVGSGMDAAADPTASIAASPPDDPVTTLVADLEASGAPVTLLGPFNPEPLAGRGVRLCLGGQEVSVYVYSTSGDRAAMAANVDRTDPSNVGTAIIGWRGDPTFWQRDRLIVLYLGRDPAAEATLRSVLGPPFATGQGRDAEPGGHAC